LGKVLKAHGTSGALRLLLEEKFKGYLRPGVFIFIDINGSKVPFRIDATDDDAHFIITLHDLTGKDQADTMGGKDIWLPVEQIKKHHQRSPAHLRDKWTEYSITDAGSGQTLEIIRTEELPQQLMAIVVINEAERYIPLHEQLIISIDKETKVIHMQLPDGLLGL
jgi:16S rRNA processing protein RimM